FVLSAIGVAVAGGGFALARRLYRVATFSYDGTQYKGRIVQPITPNELFYCVTKNVVDPKVNADLWHLELNGLVQNSAVLHAYPGGTRLDLAARRGGQGRHGHLQAAVLGSGLGRRARLAERRNRGPARRQRRPNHDRRARAGGVAE